MQTLRLSLTRQVTLLVAGFSLFFFTSSMVLHHFTFYMNLFSPISWLPRIPGEDIISPMWYSLHLAGGLVASSATLWLVLASRRRGVTGKHWLAAIIATLPFTAVLVLTSSWGRSRAYNSPGAPGIEPLVAIELFPLILALFLGYLPLASRAKRDALRRPSKADPEHPEATRFPRPTMWLLWALAAVLLVGWLAGSLYLEHGWDREEGFGSDVRHLAGVNLPILPAAAALLLILTLEMSLRAQRILHAFIVVLQLFALVPSLVLAVKAVPDFWESAVVIPLVLLLHAFWLWTSARLLEPLYGLDLGWLRVRAAVDE